MDISLFIFQENKHYREMLRKRMQNHEERLRELDFKYNELKGKVNGVADVRGVKNPSEALSIMYDFDKILYRYNVLKTFAEVTKEELSEKDMEIMGKIKAYEQGIESELPTGEFIVECPELAIIRRQLKESAVEAGKLANLAEKNSQDKEGSSSKSKSDLTNWLKSGTWGREHIQCVVDGFKTGNNLKEKEEATRKFFEERLGITISLHAAGYFFSRYGLRGQKSKIEETNSIFDEAYEQSESYLQPERIKFIKERLYEKTDMILSDKDISVGICFRNILKKNYGSLKEPSSILEGLDINI
ncbi:Piso0_003342 [Millerozyma farinosa CBS 7064]|uniref:Piso0_003342 protein n=1 Tax=Pichia sorbitophila (strain ATCC MYA-4447 / BCRC 22081 / CBS 7064 / NBRC 10061 / NRRL Y-12695) TaxID=559304 RepID=G8YHV2_PICSO|nr:Piso0_003342 [Millerozyma farinosa CBS 7064]CCE81004.1 Piso0_003342 [Millerozyma farinosa CBS 7064]